MPFAANTIPNGTSFGRSGLRRHAERGTTVYFVVLVPENNKNIKTNFDKI